MAKKNFYAIKKGKKSNVIVPTWDECKSLVNGYPGAEFKGFVTEDEAMEYLGIKKENKKEKKNKNSVAEPIKSDRVICYTDGACSGNGKPDGGAGGWGAVIIQNGKRTELSGGAADTTNNRMELTACIEALRFVRTPSNILLITDSQYVINGIVKGWVKSWKRNNWKKSDGTPVKNPDLWEELVSAIQFHKKIEFQWVKGHATTEENNRCDYMAVEQSKKYMKK